MKFSEKRSDRIGLMIIITLIALTLFLLSITFGWIDTTDNLAEITVTGEGQAFVVPDTGVFTYTVTAEGSDATIAGQEIAKSLSAINQALQEAGVQEVDIKTQNYNVFPRYELRTVETRPDNNELELIDPRFIEQGETRVLVGYEATQTNQVRVRDTDQAGKLLSLVTDNGADNVSNLDFIVWDETAIEAEARNLAIADAKVKAEQLAGQLGVTLGKISDFYENEDGYNPSPLYMDARVSNEMAFDESAPAEISLGENEVRKTVNITFQIN